MNGPVTAAIIASSTTVAVAIATAIGALWRLGRNRAYDRRIGDIRDLQNRSGELGHANRVLGRDVRKSVAKAAAGRQTQTGIVLPGQVRHVNLGPSRSPKADAAQAAATIAVEIAATRIKAENNILVLLNEYWRDLSLRHEMDRTDVTAGKLAEAWTWFNLACAQALRSRAGRLSRGQRRHWREVLAAVSDDANNTDPE